MEKPISSLIVVIVGLLFFGIGFWLFLSDYTATGWETVDGTVTHSSVLQVRDSDGDLMYKADIRYGYAYGGDSYTGYCCGYSTSDHWAMEELSRRNSEGSSAELYVNPDQPHQSRLKEDVNPFGLFQLAFMGMGGLVVILGLGRLIPAILGAFNPP